MLLTKLIIGLGNPGKEYKNTRHNIGFEVVDELVFSLNGFYKSFRKCADLAKVVYNDKYNLLLAKPVLYMNNSGVAIRKILDYYKIKFTDILVILDDYNLDVGNIRFRIRGSDGGHNGLKSIIEHISTQDFPRLRLGIGKPTHKDLSQFVLSKFKLKEKDLVTNMIHNALRAALLWINQGPHIVMQKYNKKNK